MALRPPDAAGYVGLNSEPSGAVVVIGMKQPSLFGMSEHNSAFKP